LQDRTAIFDWLPAGGGEPHGYNESEYAV